AAGDLVFCAGQVGVDPATGKLVAGGIEAETARVCENLAAVLAAAGLGLRDVVKTTVYAVGPADFPALNGGDGRYFPPPPPPGRPPGGGAGAGGRAGGGGPGRDRGGRGALALSARRGRTLRIRPRRPVERQWWLVVLAATLVAIPAAVVPAFVAVVTSARVRVARRRAARRAVHGRAVVRCQALTFRLLAVRDTADDQLGRRNWLTGIRVT